MFFVQIFDAKILSKIFQKLKEKEKTCLISEAGFLIGNYPQISIYII